MEEWFRTDTALQNREFMLTSTAEELTAFYLNNYYYGSYDEDALREILETVKGCFEVLPKPEDGVIQYYDERAMLQITTTKYSMYSFGPAYMMTFGKIYPAPSLRNLSGKAVQFEMAFAISANTSHARKTAAAEFIKMLLTDERMIQLTGSPRSGVDVFNVWNELDDANVRKITGGGFVVGDVVISTLPAGYTEKYNEDRREYYSGLNRVVSRYAGREYGPKIIELAMQFYRGEIPLDDCVTYIRMVHN
jgi:ABC-type glycerol-3-phosphate transport system substrate-binding protein